MFNEKSPSLNQSALYVPGENGRVDLDIVYQGSVAEKRMEGERGRSGWFVR